MESRLKAIEDRARGLEGICTVITDQSGNEPPVTFFRIMIGDGMLNSDFAMTVLGYQAAERVLSLYEAKPLKPGTVIIEWPKAKTCKLVIWEDA